MSSFVIEKKAFVRVAGMVSGIRDYANHAHRFNRLYIWDEERGCEMNDDGVRARFVRCWELNVDSVSKQYHDDPSIYNDDDDYLADYAAYRNYARKAAYDVEKLLDMIHELSHFASSVNYQIEDEVDNEQVNDWFRFIITGLIGLTDHKRDDRKSWGSFELDGVA